MKLFQIWTGNGKITRKDFNNRKSVLNGIFRHAVLNEIITFSPITDLPCNTLKFKLPNTSKKAYTIEERALQEDMTFSHPHRVLKDPKGNPFYSIRTEELPENGSAILRKMKELNLNGKLVFMHEGRPLTTDTFNRRLKKYCGELGITYLSSHKIRFTNASMLFDVGVKAIDIQPLLGHSNLSMTQHYIGQRTTKQDSTEMARILA